MKQFIANRLSGGNRIFPAEIKIDNFGVTVRIPGFFSGKEKSLSFDKISSVKIDCPVIGFSKVTINTIGFDNINAEGFSKTDAEEIKELVQRGIQSVRYGSDGNQSIFLPNDKLETNEHDVELQRLRNEKEKEEATQRQIKGQRLREKGRPFAAWLIETDLLSYGLGLAIVVVLFIIPVVGIIVAVVVSSILIQEATKISWKKMGIGIGIVVVILVVYGVIDNINNKKEEEALSEKLDQDLNKTLENNRQIAAKASQINLKLEKIEDEIKLSIQDGDKEKALLLANQLVHPMHERWHDADKNYPFYDEWWSNKRQSYKNQIFAMTSKSKLDTTKMTSHKAIDTVPNATADTSK